MADTNGTANAPDGDRAATEPGDSPTAPVGGGGIQAVISHMNTDRVEACMWLSRVITMMFSVSFILPFFGLTQQVSGQRVLIAGAITSALRLHQRMPPPRISREFIGLLFMEDSAHYLLYSVLMLFATNATSITLMPVFLFALLHVTKYTKTLLNLLGPTSLGIIRKLISKVDTRQREILKLIATVEITLMPTALLLIISGNATLILPFGYYRFLCMRYASIRNPYSRTVFYEMRMLVEYAAGHPNCPNMIRPLVPKAIAFVCRMAPAQQQAAAQ